MGNNTVSNSLLVLKLGRSSRLHWRVYWYCNFFLFKNIFFIIILKNTKNYINLISTTLLKKLKSAPKQGIKFKKKIICCGGGLLCYRSCTLQAQRQQEEAENNIEKTYGRRRDYLRVYPHMGCGCGLLCYRSYFSYCWKNPPLPWQGHPSSTLSPSHIQLYMLCCMISDQFI